LRAAFTEVGAAGGNKFRCLPPANILCYADERNFIGPAAGQFRRAGNSLLDSSKIVGN
jgi:hypothetical protein